jgi:TrmH family RNA methyltransferase
MIETVSISSTSNSKIKDLLSLKEKSRVRKKEGLFVLEGARELQIALGANYQIQQLFFNPKIISVDEVQNLVQSTKFNNCFEVSDEVYAKIAYRSTTEGIIAICKAKEHDLSKLKIEKKNPLILIAEAPEKPGNIGALLRTADAAGVDAVIIANPKTDLYNPNTIRASLGCLFSVPTYTASTSNAIEFLKANHINFYAATLQDSTEYTDIDFRGPSAIVVGTEATGLEEQWRKESTKNIIIPMRGAIDSMNVSVAASVLIFEAVRQRN